ncbi:MAG: PRTRC system ThiF family protein [Deltaproteobacteria bacterium]|nr:PRTRC system ThiF family protein [Deltaproteobacteria bacterium]
MKHYIHSHITAADHPVQVALVGCGGTGSQILTGLARLHYALCRLGHPGLFVSVFDGDEVSESNVARQNFSPLDIGRNKAVVSVTKINMYMGVSWKGYPCAFEEIKTVDPARSLILVTAVDSAKARLVIARKVRNNGYEFLYWLDTGNTRDSGQVILGSLKPIGQPPGKDVIDALPTVDALYDLEKVKEKAQGPSCSLDEALKQQDLLVNTMVASWAVHLLWTGFKQGHLTHHGCFIDLKSMRVNPLPVDPGAWKRIRGE